MIQGRLTTPIGPPGRPAEPCPECRDQKVRVLEELTIDDGLWPVSHNWRSVGFPSEGYQYDLAVLCVSHIPLADHAPLRGDVARRGDHHFHHICCVRELNFGRSNASECQWSLGTTCKPRKHRRRGAEQGETGRRSSSVDTGTSLLFQFRFSLRRRDRIRSLQGHPQSLASRGDHFNRVLPTERFPR